MLLESSNIKNQKSILGDLSNYLPKENKHIQKSTHQLSQHSFSTQEVTLENTPLFFPKGFEKIFLTIYIIILPYITGTLFLFFYISKGKFNLFSSLYQQTSAILNWCIGYELLAGFFILFIIKQAISFTLSSREKHPKTFRRPTK